MSPVCPCAVVQLPEYICVHCLVLSFHVLGSSLSVFELCLSLSIWATEFLLSACKVLLCAWSMRFLRPFATSMSFSVCIFGPWASFSHFPTSVCCVPVVRMCATYVFIYPCATSVDVRPCASATPVVVFPCATSLVVRLCATSVIVRPCATSVCALTEPVSTARQVLEGSNED